MTLSRKAPSKHIVDKYQRGRFTVDPHLRGKGKLKLKDDEKPQGTGKKVIVGHKTINNAVKGKEITTVLLPHDEDTVQVIHMTPQEYLMLAAPGGYSSINDYRVDRIQEGISEGEALVVPSLDVYTESLDVVASKGVAQAIWAHRKGIKKIPVMLVHCAKSSAIITSRQFYPTPKKKTLDYTKFIRQGHLGPSAWDYIKPKD